MAIPIPSGLPTPQVIDNRQNELITPPSAPAVVESLSAIDPRVALNMPLPVGDSKAGGQLQNLVPGIGVEVASSGANIEPLAQQAVILELGAASVETNQVSNGLTGNLISESLTKLDLQGSTALGQLLSDILQVELPDLGAKISTGSTGSNQSIQLVQNGVVNWPTAVVNPSNAGQIDPRVAMNNLYQNLENSGIFAADQLRRHLFPAGEDQKSSPIQLGDIESSEEKVTQLLGQLSTNSGVTQDSVKLLLRGDLIWQGQIMPNVQARLYREDAWESDPNQLGQLQKGSRLTLELDLPKLGPVRVIGTQFGESVHVSILASSKEAQILMDKSFPSLLEQMKKEVDSDSLVSIDKTQLINEG